MDWDIHSFSGRFANPGILLVLQVRQLSSNMAFSPTLALFGLPKNINIVNAERSTFPGKSLEYIVYLSKISLRGKGGKGCIHLSIPKGGTDFLKRTHILARVIILL